MLQERMLEMLRYLDQICQKHKLTYWLSSGTLLGAVRHGGFIPWDDDIDIDMPYKDVIKLTKILLDECPPEFAVQTYKTDPYFFLPYPKLRDREWIVKEDQSEQQITSFYIYKGLAIDIFPMERICLPLKRLSSKYTGLAISLVQKNKFLGKATFSLGMHLVFPLLRFLGKPFLRRDVFYHTYGYGFFSARTIKYIFPLRKIKFEGYEFSVPNDYHAYLEEMFGKNYLSLPPEDSRRPHIKRIQYKEKEYVF